MPVEECHYEWSDYYESDVQVCNWVETAEESAANWAAIYEAEARYQAAAEAAWGPGGVPPCAGPGQEGDCCPGLIPTGHPEEWDWSNGDGTKVRDAYTSCDCPSFACVPDGQALLSSGVEGCAGPSCCPPATPVNGVCKNPPGYGTYVSGPLAVNVGVGGCQGSPGWVVGKQSDCNDRYDAARARTVHEWRAYYVNGTTPDRSLCPQIGDLSGAQWVDNNNKTGFVTGEYGIGDKIRLQCVYSMITNPFETSAINTFTGTNSTQITEIQKKWCDGKNYAGLKNNGDCRTFYTNRGDYDFQLVSRIQIENPNGEWATNPGYLQDVMQIAAGQKKAAGSSVEGIAMARGMINNYCMTQNRQWADNSAIRFIIKTWALKNSLDIDESTRVFASSVIEGYCISNPSSTKCDCFNATKFRTNIFNACQGNTSNACTDINRLAAAFSESPDIFKSQVEAIKSYITPNCAVGACVSSAMNLSSEFLPPSSFAELECKSDIQVCLQSIEVGGSIAPGATINQSCKKIITAAGVTVGDTVPSDNRGLTNIQAVNANANAPGGGTLAAVISPSGSNTQVGTTGTPGGGLQHTITSNTPVGIGSTGGPVSYTSPAPVTPTSNTVTTTATFTPDNTKYALAAGGGLLGLSSSCLFFIFIIVIIMMIFGGKGKTAAPPVIPLAAYGL